MTKKSNNWEMTTSFHTHTLALICLSRWLLCCYILCSFEVINMKSKQIRHGPVCNTHSNVLLCGNFYRWIICQFVWRAVINKISSHSQIYLFYSHNSHMIFYWNDASVNWLNVCIVNYSSIFGIEQNKIKTEIMIWFHLKLDVIM